MSIEYDTSKCLRSSGALCGVLLGRIKRVDSERDRTPIELP